MCFLYCLDFPCSDHAHIHAFLDNFSSMYNSIEGSFKQTSCLICLSPFLQTEERGMTCQLVAYEDREVFIGGLKESPPASHSLSLCSDLGADMLRTTPLDFLTMLLFIPELTSKFIKSKQRCQVTWLEDRNGVTG